MTYLIMSIAGVWAVATVTFVAALGLAAKRPMPAPDTLDQLDAPGELRCAASPPPAQEWRSAAEPHGLEGAVAPSAA